MSRTREFDKANPNRGAAERLAFVARLQAILRYWPSADRLARATGVSPSAFRKWLKGEAEPSRERLVALAEAAGVSVGWLAMGEGPEPRLQSIGKPSRSGGSSARTDSGVDQQEFILLPKRPQAAAAGPETPTPPPGTEFIALRHDWVRTTLGIDPDNLLVETAVGESMQPGIQDGDILLVDTGEKTFRNFGVYVLEISGERLVKRVQPRLDGSLTLISDNRVYETEHVPASKASEVHAIGRVLWTCGPVRNSG